MKSRGPSLLLIFGLLVMGLVALLFLREPKAQVFHLATGKKDGAYFAFGNGLVETLGKESSHLSLKIGETSGSLENLDRLDHEQTDLALIQNGLRSDSQISVVARLYEEVVHMLLPKESAISKLEELRGKQVCIGLPESGTREVATQLLSHYGISGEDFTPLDISPAQSMTQLLEREADVIIMVTALRTPLIEEILATGEVKSKVRSMKFNGAGITTLHEALSDHCAA